MERQVNPTFDVPSLTHAFFFKTSLPYITNKKVLDIGCWSGMFESMAIDKVKHITGIDPSKKAITMAKKQNPKATFFVGKAEKLNFRNNTFDAVIFCEVIEHIPKGHEDRVIKEISRVLKPGGHVVLTTPHNHPISILLDPAFFLISHRHYSVNYLKKLITNNGFKIKHQSLFGGIFYLINANLELIFKHLFNTRFVPPKFLEKLILSEYKNGFAGNVIIARKK